MRSKYLPLLCACLCLSTVIFARPYHGDVFTYQQPDGSKFKIRLFGDEFYARAETLDGYTIVRDPKTGRFCYALLATDGQGFASTGVPVGKALPKGLKKKISLSLNVVRAKSAQMRKVLKADSRGLSILSQQTTKSASIQPGPPSSQTVGIRTGLVLLASFPDRQSDVTISREAVDAYCNDPNYTGYGNATSIFGYFYVQSNGKLRYNCIVTSYFTAANNRSYYTDPSISYGSRARELIREGLQVLKDDGFDFTKCDGDNNSVLDGVNIFYAGGRVNSWAEGLWPHKSGTSWSGLSGTGVSTSFQYQITDMSTSLKIGTFCHENGHMLCGFPDFYSYDGNAARIDAYSLMASSGSTHPRNIDAYLKMHAGWANVIDIDSSTHMRCGVKTDQNTFYRYRNPGKSTEYFLVSIRNNSGYEAPYGGATNSVQPTRGIVVYHALQGGSNTRSSIFTGDNPTDYSKPYELMVVEAVPSASVTPWYRDPTPGSNDGYYSGGVSSVSDSTTPAVKFWASDGRTTNSGLNIHSVSDRGDAMTFIVGSGSVTGSPIVGLTAAELEPQCEYGTNAASQTFAVYNKGGGTLNFSVSDNRSWMSVSPTSGSVTSGCSTITVNYNTSGLSAGTRTGTITVTDGSSTGTIPVTLVVRPQPTISVSPSSLSFSMDPNQTDSKDFVVSNSGGGTLYYTVSDNASWLTLGATSGTADTEDDTISANVDTTSMTGGTYNATITVSSTNATNSSQTINVSLQVTGTGNNLPTCSITSPSGGATFTEGNSITINASATDSDGTISKVEFYAGTTLLGTDTTSPYSYTWSGAPVGTHSLTAKATDNDSGSTTSSAVSITVNPDLNTGTGTGLAGQYYDTMDFTMLKMTRIDETVNFNFGSNSPDPTMGANSFSVRWTGQVETRHKTGSKTYTFYTRTDDGVRLWVNGTKLIDKWVNQGPTEYSGTISLAANQKYDITMEYYENSGGAVAELRWEVSGYISKKIIPKTQLYPAAVTPNTAPLASGQSVSVNEDEPKTITLAATDADGDSLTYSIVGNPTNGQLTMVSNNKYSYLGDANYNGSDSFTFKANDGKLDSNTATVSITVNAVNDPPVAQSNSYQTNEDTPLNVAAPGVLGNDSDVDGDTLTAILVDNVTSGSLTLNSNGSFSYTPGANFNGTDSFTYKANDTQADSSTVTVTLEVLPINDPPTADGQSISASAGIPRAVVLSGDDPDSDSLTYDIVANPTNGTLSSLNLPNLVYTATVGYTGPDSFTFRIYDGQIYSGTATVSITVTNANIAPEAYDMSVNVTKDSAKVFNLDVIDANGDPMTCSEVSGPSNGTLVISGIQATYTPNAGYTGPDSFTYKANDGAADSNAATVSITVAESTGGGGGSGFFYIPKSDDGGCNYGSGNGSGSSVLLLVLLAACTYAITLVRRVRDN